MLDYALFRLVEGALGLGEELGPARVYLQGDVVGDYARLIDGSINNLYIEVVHSQIRVGHLINGLQILRRSFQQR